MSPNKVKMPEQDPNVRNKNFEEVSLGYTKEQAMEEATRCLNCKKPFCMDAVSYTHLSPGWAWLNGIIAPDWPWDPE